MKIKVKIDNTNGAWPHTVVPHGQVGEVELRIAGFDLEGWQNYYLVEGYHNFEIVKPEPEQVIFEKIVEKPAAASLAGLFGQEVKSLKVDFK